MPPQRRGQKRKIEKTVAKVFNDPVHGSIEVDPVAMLIIDTPLFQRLRSLKQLGGLSHVYPGGTHTRFEHSIGVYHLAGKVINSLKKNQPNLRITDKEALCVQLAGLCHDLGHGPFSHLFEEVVRELRKRKCSKAEKWTHEDQSVWIMDHLFKDLEKNDEAKSWRFGEDDFTRIKDMVLGKKKGFLYEIVFNSENGMDVDKWDYFARDAYHLGMKTNFEHDRLIFYLKVLTDENDDEQHIYVRDKEQFTVFTMFATRYALHKTAYQHPVNHGVEMMIKEAVVLAAPHLRFAGKDGEHRDMLEALDDLEAYTKLHDGIYHMILNYAGPGLEELDDEEYTKAEELTKAKELLERIERRDLWKCVGQLVPETNEDRPAAGNNQPEPNLGRLRRKLNRAVPEVPRDSFRVRWASKDFGMKDENPLKKIRFFNKEGEPVEPGRLLIAPNEYLSKGIRVYWTDPKEGLTDEIQERITRVLREQDGLRLTYGHD